MALHLRPVGPLPAAVYWTRRAGVLLLVLLLLALLTRCGGRRPRAAGSRRRPRRRRPPSAAPTVSPPAAPSPAVVGPCPDAALRVSSTPGRAAYPLGTRPVLRLGIRNGGTVPCVRDLGQAAVELLIFSGPDRVWSSDDCAPGGGSSPTTLQPQQLEVITLTWAARRSRPGCAGDQAAITPGTYRVVGRVGEVLTLGTTFLVR